MKKETCSVCKKSAQYSVTVNVELLYDFPIFETRLLLCRDHIKKFMTGTLEVSDLLRKPRK